MILSLFPIQVAFASGTAPWPGQQAGPWFVVVFVVVGCLILWVTKRKG